MYAPLIAPLVVGLGGGIFVVWLVASFVPVDARRLPVLLRVARFPAARRNPPRSVQIAALSIKSRDSLWGYRLFAGAIVLLSQTVQLRSATDAHMAATMGAAPLLEACGEWFLMLTWSLYVVWQFRRAGLASR